MRLAKNDIDKNVLSITMMCPHPLQIDFEIVALIFTLEGKRISSVTVKMENDFPQTNLDIIYLHRTH